MLDSNAQCSTLDAASLTVVSQMLAWHRHLTLGCSTLGKKELDAQPWPLALGTRCSAPWKFNVQPSSSHWYCTVNGCAWHNEYHYTFQGWTWKVFQLDISKASVAGWSIIFYHQLSVHLLAWYILIKFSGWQKVCVTCAWRNVMCMLWLPLLCQSLVVSQRIMSVASKKTMFGLVKEKQVVLVAWQALYNFVSWH